MRSYTDVSREFGRIRFNVWALGVQRAACRLSTDDLLAIYCRTFKMALAS